MSLSAPSSQTCLIPCCHQKIEECSVRNCFLAFASIIAEESIRIWLLPCDFVAYTVTSLTSYQTITGEELARIITIISPKARSGWQNSSQNWKIGFCVLSDHYYSTSSVLCSCQELAESVKEENGRTELVNRFTTNVSNVEMSWMKWENVMN